MAAASAMRPVVASMRAAIGASKRTFATANKQSFASRAQPSPRASLSHAQLGQSFRRSYADAVKPIKPKKSGLRIFRWAWRATYLSAIAGLAYTAYGIYEMKNPGDQAEPDPSKKTLVILGMCLESLPHGLH
jgi:NADH:ubiquinone reductase (non-electrogenic)